MFVLGTDAGWVPAEADAGPWIMEQAGDGPRIHFTPGTQSAACSPSFSVVPGLKYRITFRLYATDGPQSTYLRIMSTALYAPNIINDGAPNKVFTGFMDAGTVTPTNQWIDLTYDWVAPAGSSYASLHVYHWAGVASDLYCQGVKCVPYAGTGQWGADVTGANTSNDTNNVAGVPAVTIATVVPTGFKLFINSGSRSYSLQAI
jgi:hypothetical protein